MTEKGSPIKHIRKRCISRYSKVVHNIELPFAYSLFTLQMQNQLLSRLIDRNKGWFLNDVPFSPMRVLRSEQIRDDPTSLTHERIRRNFHHILRKTIEGY